MKKIIAGILGIVMVAGVVGGAAYALFTASVTANGVAFSTGNAALDFSENGTTNWTSTIDLSDAVINGVNGNLYPGFQNSRDFYLRNTSTSPISLSLTTKLTASRNLSTYGDDWAKLSPVSWVMIENVTNGTNSGWYTLADWTTEKGLNTTIAQSEVKHLKLHFSIDQNADNGIANRYVGTDWVTTGTQVTP